MKAVKRLEMVGGELQEIYYFTMNLDEEKVKVDYAFTNHGDRVIVFDQEVKNVDDDITEIGDIGKLYIWDKEEDRILQLELYKKEVYTKYYRTIKNKKIIRTHFWIKKQYKRKENADLTYEPMFDFLGLEKIYMDSQRIEEELLKNYKKVNWNSK